MLTAALVLTALAAGAAGTWSPCGFSAIATIGNGGRRPAVVAASSAAFGVGAVAGGIATFAALSALGSVVGAGRALALAATAVVAAAAAAGELAGVRVVPQIRRQVPEPLRRALPLPVTALAYGLLLGLGFTTFVLTLAFWALAAIALVQGSVALGVATGAAFGVGRALPVAALSLAAERDRGISALETLAERPRLLRGWRVVCAAALAAAAVAAWL